MNASMRTGRAYPTIQNCSVGRARPVRTEGFIFICTVRIGSANPLMYLDLNEEVAGLSRELAWPRARLLRLTLPQGQVGVRLRLPPDLDLEEVIKYPLVIYL